MTPHPDLQPRLVRNLDSAGIIALVGGCFREYPGCLLDVNREESGLLDPESSFASFWVIERDDRIVGTIACNDHEVGGEALTELKKLYLHPKVRGHGLARRLVGLVEQHARQRGSVGVDLWTDTRFTKAHAAYRHFGYEQLPPTRELGDISSTVEFYYRKNLAP